MNIDRFSKKYKTKKLSEADTYDVFSLCSKNKMYYEYCPPMVTEESIIEDMNALPPNIELKDKYYIGYFFEDKLIAVLDLIDGYPENKIAFIGFFMMDISLQKKGIGSNIISELCDYLKGKGFEIVRLAWAKGNPQSEHFWLKNKFIIIKETISTACNSVILGERKL